LEDLGFDNISHDKTKEILRFARESGRNPTSTVFNLNTLSYHCFSNNDKGNLYTLCMKKKEISFLQALDYITEKAGLEKSQFQTDVKFPFGGFYKDLLKDIVEPELSMKTYPESILEPYKNKYNMLFFKDGIDFQAQEEFGIGYDFTTNRITIPEYSLDNKLIGIMGRLNDKHCAKEERYLPIIPCSRSLTLYGYAKNYSAIQEKDLCLIVESEKSIMKLFSMGCNNAVASCGCHISDIQAKYLKALLIKRYIVCYDEGLKIEDIIEECKKLQVDNLMFQNQIGFIYDLENKYLPKDSKLSPCDMPKDIFKKIIQECTIWL
jgi:DNA primase